MREFRDDFRRTGLRGLGQAVIGAQGLQALLGPLHVHQTDDLGGQLVGGGLLLGVVRLLSIVGLLGVVRFLRVVGFLGIVRLLRVIGFLGVVRLLGCVSRSAGSVGTAHKHLHPIVPVAAGGIGVAHADVGIIRVHDIGPVAGGVHPLLHRGGGGGVSGGDIFAVGIRALLGSGLVHSGVALGSVRAVVREFCNDLRGADLRGLGEAVVSSQRLQAFLGPLHVHQTDDLGGQLVGGGLLLGAVGLLGIIGFLGVIRFLRVVGLLGIVGFLVRLLGVVRLVRLAGRDGPAAQNYVHHMAQHRRGLGTGHKIAARKFPAGLAAENA